ncbi:TetR/AcrR family transcriptional regulator [Brachybacterium sp. JHP9]|uniref:TetR/AcrR family transcriptional regulator n=1 Tax=Brachybacterium equifaecis TaxID=2910770 RepID=A0ABT0R0V8_9MICO|nr:TetR/AcrR family transcriptional regulator [Brachybacterium equifaecis]MCL6422590.1 TetR/AcrR family transcriptional regulator [Brachybacterium equifaecis]
MEQMTRAPGRPRSFDLAQALHDALLTFWKHGYEGTSVARLQAATGLTAPALYRAFGSKEELFRSAVDRYQEQYGFGLAAGVPFRSAVAAYLRRAAHEFTTEPGLGCLISTGLLASGPDSRVSAEVVRAERKKALADIRSRCQAAVDSGELPESTDIAGLSRAIAAVIQGMSVQARDGATEIDLLGLGESAIRLIPDHACPGIDRE